MPHSNSIYRGRRAIGKHILPACSSDLIADTRTSIMMLKSVDAARTSWPLPTSDSPLHRYLPPELLIEIFARLHPEKRDEIHYLHVCSAWRTLLLKTAEFWVDMLRIPSIMGYEDRPPTDIDIEFANTFMERSASLDIDVTVHISPKLTPAAFASRSQRILSLVLYIESQYAADLFQVLTTGMPHLRQLVVHHKYEGLNHPPRFPSETTKLIRTASFALPSLRDLRIPFAFLAPGLANSSLRTLAMGGCYCSDCIGSSVTLDTILTFLEKCPSLEDLHIKEEGRKPHVSSRSPVALPSLRKLALGGDDFWSSNFIDIPAILRHLTLPADIAVKIRYPYSDQTYIPPMRELPIVSLLDRLYVRFIKARGYKIVKVEGWIADATKIDLESRMYSHPGHDTVDQLVNTFGSQIVKDLEIWVSGPGVYKEMGLRGGVEQLLRGFPSITRLKVRRQRPDELFVALASVSRAGVPICPDLKELVVHWKLAPGTTVYEEDFWSVFDRIESTLLQRASKGHGLARFVFRCEDIQRLKPAVPPEELKQRLLVKLSSVAEEVVVNAYIETKV
ncbi:hypothetical protein BD310DRAFT_913029 [Dichomitus squalens]|uniref:F-box domain-containing protein n=1 Tax=Dichomitus squalens TaxID=114155 RepID=A0A4Q9QAG1_9APHY|nr:hypothetical protein BD310DRAFT_913029 [Dichomitus squalens]